MDISGLDQFDIEFYSLEDKVPEGREKVLIILKKGVDSGNPTPWFYNKPRPPVIYTDKETLDFATYITYKTRAGRFNSKTASRIRTFKAEDILYWGRLK